MRSGFIRFGLFLQPCFCFLFFILYRVRPHIPVLKDVQPLLEMDRDERKLDVFLTFHRSSLLITDMKIFLPFTINLDPYIKKKIKEEQQVVDEEAVASGIYKPVAPWNINHNRQEIWPHNKSVLTNRQHRSSRGLNPQVPVQPGWAVQAAMDWQPPPWMPLPPMEPMPRAISAITTIPVREIFLLFIIFFFVLKNIYD